MDKCTSIDHPGDGLKTWLKIVERNEKQYPELRTFYDQKLTELTNG